MIAQLQRGEAERAELLLWRRVLATIGESVIDFARLAGAGPVLHARLFVFPPDSEPELPPGTLSRTVDLDHVMVCALCALTVGAGDDVEQLAQQAALLKGRVYDAPPWLRADAAETERYIAPRLEALARETERLNADLEALHARHDLYTALGDAQRLQWLIENVRALESGDLFCWITGWTSDFAGEQLAAALERSGARALLHFPPPAPKARAPLLLANPMWAKPFEIFSRALGMPARNEADPSILLAVAVPLMFGYMFGDVGQGLVIAAVGFAVRRRFPIARLFIAGGLAAAVFGLLFGSCVLRPREFHPLWKEPLDDPLAILTLPLAGGAALLTVGLALNALEAWWRSELPVWLATDAGYVAAYLGILVGFLNSGGFVVAAVGAVVFCAGHAFHARRASAALTAHRRTRRATAADPDQHAVVRARRCVRARARGPLVGDRRDDERVGQPRDQGRGPRRRQRARAGARDDGRVDPDHAPRPVRVLHPLPDGGGTDLPPAARTPFHHPGELNGCPEPIRRRARRSWRRHSQRLQLRFWWRRLPRWPPRRVRAARCPPRRGAGDWSARRS